MTLNISDARGTEPESPEAAARSRAELIDELLSEMGAWNTRTRLTVFRRWHQGAVSLIHLHVLTVLEADGSLPMNRVAEALDVSVASATGIVDRMVKRDLVERRQDAEDRRVVLVEATAHGLAVIREIETEARARMARLLAELSDDELAGFLRGIRAIHEAGLRINGHVPRAVTLAAAQRAGGVP